MKVIANGLMLHMVKTKAETLAFNGNLSEFLKEHFKEDGYIVAYLYHEVLMGIFKEGRPVFYNGSDIDQRYLLRLRLFNESKELYVWRSGDIFKARLRIDGEGEETPVIDAHQVLWGTRAEIAGEFTRLTEDRGTNLIVPLKGISVDSKRKRLFLRTRNYVAYAPSCQATYMDFRFMGFSNSYIKEAKDGESQA